MALSLAHTHPERRQHGLALVWWAFLTLGLALGAFILLPIIVPGWMTGPGSMGDGQAHVSTLQQEVEDLRGQLDIERTRHAVDRQALEMVRREMAQQKEHTADLEENLRFYRSLMAPEGVEHGIRLRAPELVEREGSAQVAFRFVVQQEARKHDLVKGELTIAILGQLAGEEVRYTLPELAEAVSDTAIALQFRYFQSLEGELSLPENFAPVSLEVVAVISKPYKVEVQKSFPWQLQERFSRVGK